MMSANYSLSLCAVYCDCNCDCDFCEWLSKFQRVPQRLAAASILLNFNMKIAALWQKVEKLIWKKLRLGLKSRSIHSHNPNWHASRTKRLPLAKSYSVRSSHSPTLTLSRSSPSLCSLCLSCWPTAGLFICICIPCTHWAQDTQGLLFTWLTSERAERTYPILNTIKYIFDWHIWKPSTTNALQS